MAEISFGIPGGKCPSCGAPIIGGGNFLCFKCKEAEKLVKKACEYLKIKSYEEAIPLLEESAAKDNATAIYNLCACYYNGTGVKKDIKKAIELLKKAADKGHEMAKKQISELRDKKIMFGGAVAQDIYNIINYFLEEI